MEDYNGKLMYLIELKKKKKEPNSLERSEFADAWSMLGKKKGFQNAQKAFFIMGLLFVEQDHSESI